MLRGQGWVRLNSMPVPWKPIALMGDTWKTRPLYRDRRKAVEQTVSPNSTPDFWFQNKRVLVNYIPGCVLSGDQRDKPPSYRPTRTEG